jgi:hypothetical protein
MDVDEDVPPTDDLERKVAAINQNTITLSTKKAYIGPKIDFIQFLDREKPELLHDAWRASAPRDAKGLKRPFVRDHLFGNKSPCPVKLGDITAADIQRFVASMKSRKESATSVGFSTHNTTRSALRDLYRSYGVVENSELLGRLKNFYKGLKRTTTQLKVQGKQKLSEGKVPLDSSLFRFFCEALIKSGRGNDMFCHVYLALSWSLMCRSANTASICYEHMGWKNDCLQIFFAHSKTDQDGDRPKHPRHIFANPLHPAICPILALGIFFICNKFSNPNDVFLFSGSNQKSRFLFCFCSFGSFALSFGACVLCFASFVRLLFCFVCKPDSTTFYFFFFCFVGFAY